MPSTTYPALPRPSIMQPEPWAGPAVRAIHLGEGPTAYVHHIPGRNVAAIQVWLGVPLHAEPREAEGTATVMATSLAPARLAEFEETRADYGLAWHSGADYTGPRLACEVSTANLGPALSLIAAALARPLFHEKDVAAQTMNLYQRLAYATDPGGLALGALSSVICDPQSRTGRPVAGTPDSLANITSEGVREFYQQHVNAANAVVCIAADLHRIAIEDLLRDAFAIWSPTGPATGICPVAGQAPAKPSSVLVIPPAAPSPQAHLTVAAPTLDRGHTDYPAFALAGTVLGMPIVGRLDAELRERQGLTYASRAQWVPLGLDHAVFTATTSVKSEHTIIALGEIEEILRTAHQDGFTEADVAAVRDGFCHSVPMGWQDAPPVAEKICELITQGLPADFDARVYEAARTLTAEQVTGAFRRHFDPADLRYVIVGDAALQQPLTDFLDHELRLQEPPV